LFGRPWIETRFMIGLLLLEHIYGLSDEGVCERWVHDPYFQIFTGEEFFQHAFPHGRSDLSHWRKRLGDKLERLLAESLRVAHEAGALRGQDLKRVLTGCPIERAYVDKGYRGHDGQNPGRVFISSQKRGVFGIIKRELRRRSAIEPIIVHMKAEGHLGHCYLKGRAGDAANVWRAGAPYARLCAAWYDLAVCCARCRLGVRHRQMLQAPPGG
jgi:hypothetical protein